MLLKLLTTLTQIPQVSTKYCRIFKELIFTLAYSTHDQNRNRNHIKFCFTYFLCIKAVLRYSRTVRGSIKAHSIKKSPSVVLVLHRECPSHLSLRLRCGESIYLLLLQTTNSVNLVVIIKYFLRSSTTLQFVFS